MSTKRFKSSLPPFALLLGLLFVSGQALAQVAATEFVDIRPKQNSPLSRFGLGDPLDQVHAAQAGMGALQSTFQDAYHLNLLNPASLASLQATSFEIGLYGRYSNLADRTTTATAYQGNLRYLALGFPLRNPINLSLEQQQNSWNAGMAFSLAPTTLVGYDLELNADDPEAGPTSNNLKGNGGAYRVSWSTALRFRGLSGGVNVNYNFGKLTNSRILVFDSIPEALATESLDELSISGFSLGYGVQYAFNFKDLNEEGLPVANGKRIIVAANGQLGASVDSESSLLFRKFSPLGNVSIRDTISFEDNIGGTVDLPASYTFGIAYDDFNRFFVGAEYGRTAYGSYRNTEQPEQLADVNRFALGLQFIPNATSYNNYWARVRYRLGARLEDDPRVIEGVQARRNAVTLGFGLPIQLPRQQISFLDLAVEYGKFGVPDILDESYVQLTLGFSLNDNSWFFKRKLN
ncbi:hypothetical protein CLV84_3875 [Neolewinella xylanilytica]|uniref:Long-subunit fatty acid transport protein n=1 Tax=Neolewinella xylanilytica TaxID=1514080 RepID=A0A2S6I1G0_9BACT|nr:hypothetical protein [Neolewinella xylanilytica]PPK84713.1 hypothetical protein CLV84_3875 [Neolewinella xylanilytica]